MPKQPNNDRVWLVKWIATIFVMVAITSRSAGYNAVFHAIDLICTLCGTTGWLYVSIVWKDRALIMMNTAILIIVATGLLRTFA